MDPRPLILTADELLALTGYSQSHKQLEELRRQGYHRARRSPVTGRVILERAHYEAVAAGAAGDQQRPRVKMPPRMRVA